MNILKMTPLLAVFAASISSANLTETEQQMLAAEIYYETAFGKIATYSQANNSVCLEQYQNLADKEIIKVQVSLGYYDNHEIVVDSFEESGIRTNLLQPCTGKHILCGYKNYDSRKNIFYKRQTGPDRKDRIILLRLDSSSVSTLDSKNKTELKELQDSKSEYTRKNFLQSFGEFDIVFYIGHSRDGGGPDFNPPLLLDNGHVNYPHYRKTTPGLNDIIAVLEGKEKSPDIVGLFSCDSNGHFLNAIVDKLPTTKHMILTHKVTNKVYASFVYSLNAVLSFQCREIVDEKLEQFDSHMLETTDAYFAM